LWALSNREEPGKPQMPDRRHDAQPDRRLLQEPEVLRDHPRRLGLLGDVLQMRQHRAAEIAQQDAPPLAVKERRAEFRLERLDALGQRRLRDAQSAAARVKLRCFAAAST
jgi:hypothetical protein